MLPKFDNVGVDPLILKVVKSNKDQEERKYVGEMINGKPNGLGTETFENGNTYSGQWKNGKFHGQGIYTNNIYGQTFEGEELQEHA